MYICLFFLILKIFEFIGNKSLKVWEENCLTTIGYNVFGHNIHMGCKNKNNDISKQLSLDKVFNYK